VLVARHNVPCGPDPPFLLKISPPPELLSIVTKKFYLNQSKTLHMKQINKELNRATTDVCEITSVTCTLRCTITVLYNMYGRPGRDAFI